MMNFAFQMMNFALKMMNLADGAGQVACPANHAGTGGPLIMLSFTRITHSLSLSLSLSLCGAGGQCSVCGPGTDANTAKTICNDCPRYMYNPGGLGCLPCQSGSVPNDVLGSTFCVSCSLENEPQTAGQRYVNVDWFACLLNAISCPPGEAFNGDMSGKLMHFVLKMMHFALKSMHFCIQNDEFGRMHSVFGSRALFPFTSGRSL